MPTVLEQQEKAIDGSSAIDDSAADGEPINEKALLIENMELVEPRKVIHVPNHILETKTFAKVGQNALIHTKPAIVHFEGFEVGHMQKKRLVILNASSDILRMHIIPPQTKHFYIRYTKPERMVAGTTLDCTVEFTLDEWRYYYDCIRIHCPGEENLLIPIHGYPIMSTKDFPRNYTFQSIPVGHRISRTFPLKCMAPIDFEFNIKYLQPHPAFLVEPLSGIVPANGMTEISITFAPFEFQTATMRLELNVSQFNSQCVVCTFTGSSQPGLLKTKTMSSMEADVLDPRCVTPLDRARRNHQKSSRRVKLDGDAHKSQSGPTFLEKGGIRFPADLNTPHAIAKVMMQEPGKLKVNEMRETMLAKNTSSASTRQMKEAVFDHSVRQNVYEERQNQLRWQVKIGDDPISAKSRYEVLEERDQAMKFYMFKKRGDPIPEDEYGRPKTSLTYKRTFREVDTLGSRDAQFDTYSNDLWASRHSTLGRFVQAARTVIIRNRGQRRLNCLKNFTVEYNRKKYSSSDGGDSRERSIDMASPNGSPEPNLFLFSAKKVQNYKFPTYVPPNVKDDMAPDALGDVPFTPTTIFVKRDVPFFNLKVPHSYKLQNYKQHNSHNASSGYVPTTRVRTLRTGAEDEVINLPSENGPAVDSPRAAQTDLDDGPASARVPMTAATASTIADATVVAGDMIPVASHHQPVSLTPPDSLFKSIEYPSLHIMNPAPGLQVFQAPMPYAEVDYDFHLCPLPRYPRSDPSGRQPPTQKKFLDREDTIRGMMSWKKFPSQGLTSLSNTPTLTNVWVPRWDDCFSGDLLPEDVPPLFDRLAADDAENVVEDNDTDSGEGGSMHLKPEMVSAQFTLIDPSTPSEDQKVPTDLFPYGNRMPNTNIPVGTHGPVAREKREEELEYFMTKKYNRLGSKVKSKISALNGLVSDPDLVLK